MDINNILISETKKLYYSLYETSRLKFERMRFKKRQDCRKGQDFSIFIYIPTYNRGRVLVERAVDSVLNQSFKNFKVLVVGDGCTDDTEDRLSRIKDKRLNYINLYPRRYRAYPDQPIYHWMMGATIPANFALDNVEGDFIARIDDDDIWCRTHLEESYNFLMDGGYEFMTSHQEIISNGVTELTPIRRAEDPYYTRGKLILGDESPFIGGMSSYFYRSYLSFFRFNSDAWRKSWCRTNDIDFTQRVYKAGVRIGFFDRVLSSTSPRPGRSSTGSAAIYEKSPNELY